MNEADMGDVSTAEDRLLKAAEVQRELGVSRATAYRMMTDGVLPAYRFGGRNGRRPMVRVSLKELRAWLDAHRAVPPSAA
jgi:excisionase family DNA binding protein